MQRRDSTQADKLCTLHPNHETFRLRAIHWISNREAFCCIMTKNTLGCLSKSEIWMRIGRANDRGDPTVDANLT